MTQYPAQLDRNITVRGGERPTLAVNLPASSLAIVLAAEHGIDVTLEMLNPAGHIVGRSDSPVPRSGAQTTTAETTSAGEYTVALVAKDDAGVHGEVHLRVVAVSLPIVAGSCVDLQRQIATADGTYANGLLASRQIGSSPRDAHKPGPNAALNSRTAASSYAEAAARLAAGRRGSHLLAQVEHAAAAVYYADLADWAAARRFADRAAADYLADHDAYDNARAQALSAAAQMEIAVSLPASPGTVATARPSSVGLAAAREQLSRLARFHSERGEFYEQAEAVNNIGLTYFYGGRNTEAIAAYRSALRRYQRQSDKVRIAQVLNNIALAEYALGHLARAAQRYSDALQNLSAEETPQPYAFILNNLGLAHFELGNYDVALRELSQALELWRAAQNVREQARSLQWIGSVYDAVGDQDQALEYYRAALALRDGRLDARGRVTSLRTTASLIRVRGDAAGALGLHEEALALAATPAVRARLIVEIAMDLAALGRINEARQRVQSALSLPGSDAVSRAMLLLQHARLAGAGRGGDSQRELRDALQTFGAYELTGLEFDSWMALAYAQRVAGAISDALASTDRALACAEMLRVQSANPELRATLLQPLRPAYDFRISLLAAQYFGGHDDDRANDHMLAALATAELSRARALEDFESFDMRAADMPPGLLAKRSEVLRGLATERNQLEVRLEHAAVDDTRVVALRAGITEGRRQLTQIDAQLGSLSERHSDSGRRPRSTLVAQARSLPPDVAIVEYWLGAERSFAWVLTRERVTMTPLESGARINQLAVAFHAGLRDIATRTVADRMQLGAALHDLIIKPIAPYLAGKPNLILVPDGALHYVSFAALHPGADGGGRFLVQDHDLSIIPSIATYGRAGRSVARSPAGKKLLLVSDPVYQIPDNRVAARAPDVRMLTENFAPPPDAQHVAATNSDLQSLPGTAAEGRAIAALLPATAVDVLEGPNATRQQFLSAALESYRLIHIATHGVVDTQIPQLSSLIMSTRDRQGRSIDGRVMAADFMSLRLSADLVVLSACDTALGKNIIGEGLVGLRYLILARGAHAVVASLWAVPDQIGARLMTAFYGSMINDHMRPSHALSSAMRALLAEQVVDPALWAAFDLTLRDSRV